MSFSKKIELNNVAGKRKIAVQENLRVKDNVNRFD